MPEFTSAQDIKNWISSLSLSDARNTASALSSRCAMRALPGLARDRRKIALEKLFLPVFRAIVTASASSIFTDFPSAYLLDTDMAADQAANDAASARIANAAYSAASMASYAAACTVADNALLAAGYFESTISRIRSGSGEIPNLFADMQMLKDHNKLYLFKQPLWTNSGIPDEFANDWFNLKKRLLNDADDWRVWTDWYEQVLRGAPINIDFVVARALIQDEIWKQGPRFVNAEIKRLADEHGWPKRQDEMPERAEIDLPNIPPLKPAMIEPEIVNDRIVLPKRAADSALDPATTQAALQSLRTEIESFLDEAREAPGQDDRRLIQWLEKIPAQIPSEPPTQQQIFTLGHAQERLALTIQKLNEESPNHLAVSGMALNLHFERTMLQFAKWKEFKRNAATANINRNELAGIQSFIFDAAIEIRNEDASEVIASEISEVIAEQADSLSSAIETIENSFQPIVSDASLRLAEDAVEGINNVFKRAAEWMLRRLKPLRSIASGYTNSFGKSAVSEAKVVGKEDGKKFIRWLRNLAVKTAKWGIGLGASGFLASQFGWLQNFFEILVKLGL